jgi:hypothetical protein
MGGFTRNIDVECVCGSDDVVLRKIKYKREFQYSVICNGCRRSTDYYDSEEKAIEEFEKSNFSISYGYESILSYFVRNGEK